MSSRKFLPVAALLALAAWANAQAMACCWVPDALASIREEIAGIVDGASFEAPMASDHSCCPGSKEADEASGESGRSASAMPGCGMEAQGVSSPCCEAGEAAAVSSSSASSGKAFEDASGTIPLTESRFAVVPASKSPPRLVLSSPPDGSPPFLSFQRLLI